MMKMLFDLLPVILFFVVYKWIDIYAATLVAIVSSAVQIIAVRLYTGKVENMQLFTLVILFVLGGLTLWLQDERFIKWKPTLVNWGFAIAMLGYSAVMRVPTMKKLLGAKIVLPDPVWRRLDWMWIAFFVCCGALNLWVAYVFSTDAWVNFKLFGLSGAALVFVIIQGAYLSRHMQNKE